MALDDAPISISIVPRITPRHREKSRNKKKEMRKRKKKKKGKKEEKEEETQWKLSSRGDRLPRRNPVSHSTRGASRQYRGCVRVFRERIFLSPAFRRDKRRYLLSRNDNPKNRRFSSLGKSSCSSQHSDELNACGYVTRNRTETE